MFRLLVLSRDGTLSDWCGRNEDAPGIRIELIELTMSAAMRSCENDPWLAFGAPSADGCDGGGGGGGGGDDVEPGHDPDDDEPAAAIGGPLLLLALRSSG